MKTKHLLKEGFGVWRSPSSSCRLIGCRVMCGMIVLLILVSTQVPTYSNYLLKSLNGPIVPDDPELLEYIRNEILEPPSKEPYDLLGEANIAKKGEDHSELFYHEVLWKLFKDKREGYFVEAGALDGETMSNTLHLEQELGWTGLLVEPDKYDFKSLKTKHRKAWAANVCLSPKPHPSKEMLTQHVHYAGPMAVALGFKMRAMHSLATYAGQKSLGNSWFTNVQCLPLESLLFALNVTKIDLMVLDVEGAELDILNHLDLHKFDVQVLCMEWKIISEIDKISEKFEKRGYLEVARSREDIILVKKGSPYMPKGTLLLQEKTTDSYKKKDNKA